MASSNDIKVDTTEPLLSVDKYYKPLVAKGEDYATLMLIRLILLEPGTFQTHPNMGVGLVSRFRYATDISMVELSNSIKNQIMLYLPQFTLTDVRCILGDEDTGDQKVIKIYITSEELNAYIPINVETGEVLQKTATLADFK